MNDSEADKQIPPNTPVLGQDNFSGAADAEFEKVGTTEIGVAERRLHLLAFDYWHSLKSDRAYPLFSELRAEDLAPFKTHSLLLEFNQSGTVVRFLGEEVSSIVDAQLSVGSYLADFPESSFARALLAQFADTDARKKAAEFEFIEGTLSCRGIMLPYSRDGSGSHFIMVVASFRKSEEPAELASEKPGEAQQDNLEALNGLVSAGQRAADTIVHMDNGNRTSLYAALASALALYEAAQKNPAAYEATLQQVGLKAQMRAPFTPVLKLVFGSGYDKTRLTEYAASLAYGLRNGQTSETLTDFLVATPGGIKGCVQRERALKRGEKGTAAHSRQLEAIETLRELKAIPLNNMTAEDEFCLILARKNSDGGLEALGRTDVSKVTLDAAIRQMASPTKVK